MYDDTILFDWHIQYIRTYPKNMIKPSPSHMPSPHSRLWPPIWVLLFQRVDAKGLEIPSPPAEKKHHVDHWMLVPSMTQEFLVGSSHFFSSGVMWWTEIQQIVWNKISPSSNRLLFTVFIHSFTITIPLLHPEVFLENKKMNIQNVKFPSISPSSCFKSYHALPFYRLGRVPTSVQFAEAKRAREGLNLALYQWTPGSWWFFWGSPQIVVRQGEMPCCQRQKMIQLRVNRIGNTS